MQFSPNWEPAHAGRLQLQALAGATPTVLVVDDDWGNRASYRSILDLAGYRVIEAEDALAGVRLARQIQPNFILMELAMPTMDGWEANRLLKADAATYMIPVAAMSARAMPEGTYHRARIAGFIDFVTRPIEKRHVLALVREWIRPALQT